MAAVTIRNLTVAIAGTAIIENLSLDVASGEFLVLLGPSGCGKSTLLNGIAGLSDVSGGAITIDGREVTDADPADRNIGMVFQSYALYPTMTVAGNLSFGLRMRGVGRDQVAARVRHAAELLKPETSWFLVGFVSTVPRRELPQDKVKSNPIMTTQVFFSI